MFGHCFCFVIEQKLDTKPLSQSSSIYNITQIINIGKKIISRRMFISYRYLKCEIIMIGMR